MGLRVNTNLAALNTRLNLRAADEAQGRSLERLSTGLRINRAADDPGGLAASQQYRARIDGINQAMANAENAQSAIATAESALGKIADLILKVRESAMYALNEGGITSEELAAEQAAVDNAIASIDRIAKTTRFGSKGLLNGQSGYIVSNGTPASVLDVGVYAANFTGPYAGQSNITMIVNQTLSGERASAVVTGLSGPGNLANHVKVQITGVKGAETLVILSSDSFVQAAAKINALTAATGVFASNDTVSVVLQSEMYGYTQSARCTQVSGTNVAGLTVYDNGVDADVYVNGMKAGANGLSVTAAHAGLNVRFSIGSAANATGVLTTLTVWNTGMNFNLGATGTGSDILSIGVPLVTADKLGSASETTSSADIVGGTLEEVKSGGTSDLATDASNAVYIVDRALSDINYLRTFMGTTEADTIGGRVESLEAELIGTTEARSLVRDLDFAEETAEFTRAQIIFQAGVSTIASANLIPQSILSLLA